MIDIRKLKELVKLMVGNDLTELDLRDPEEQVTLRRPNQWTATPPQAAAPVVAPAPVTAAPTAAPTAAAPDAAPAAVETGLIAIPSPMVGTFYSSPSPDADPFLAAGSEVSADTVVCMIEAMKIFNEIKADCAGTIETICVNNGDAVEFGQDLFLVRPA